MRFDPVSVRIDDECSIVVGAIVLPQARSTVVSSMCGKGGFMETGDTLTGWRHKADMQAGVRVCRNRAGAVIHPQDHGVLAVAEGAIALAQASVPERCQDGIIEGLGSAYVLDTNR